MCGAGGGGEEGEVCGAGGGGEEGEVCGAGGGGEEGERSKEQVHTKEGVGGKGHTIGPVLIARI